MVYAGVMGAVIARMIFLGEPKHLAMAAFAFCFFLGVNFWTIYKILRNE
jgi:hypothetical protein